LPWQQVKFSLAKAHDVGECNLQYAVRV